MILANFWQKIILINGVYEKIYFNWIIVCNLLKKQTS